MMRDHIDDIELAEDEDDVRSHDSTEQDNKDEFEYSPCFEAEDHQLSNGESDNNEGAQSK